MNGNGGELSSFLKKLSEDSELEQAYRKDPEGTMRQAGLSEETTRTPSSRDQGTIRAALEKEVGADANLYMIVIAPGDEP
jgi:hypothetical protein